MWGVTQVTCSSIRRASSFASSPFALLSSASLAASFPRSSESSSSRAASRRPVSASSACAASASASAASAASPPPPPPPGARVGVVATVCARRRPSLPVLEAAAIFCCWVSVASCA